MFRVPQVCKMWGTEIPLSKPWGRLCQGETVKVKFVYNRLTGENAGRPNQISHHLQKSTRRVCLKIFDFNVFFQWNDAEN